MYFFGEKIQELERRIEKHSKFFDLANCVAFIIILLAFIFILFIMIGNNEEKPNLNESAWNKVDQYETTKNLHEVLNRDKYQENLKYLESLSFLKNKNEMMQIYNPNFSIPISERKLIEEL